MTTSEVVAFYTTPASLACALGIVALAIASWRSNREREAVTMAGGEAAHPMTTEKLNHYWADPGQPGAAKIRWGVPGDFDRCVREMHKVGVPAHMIPGHCANLHRRATGASPGHAPGAEQAMADAKKKNKKQ